MLTREEGEKTLRSIARYLLRHELPLDQPNRLDGISPRHYWTWFHGFCAVAQTGESSVLTDTEKAHAWEVWDRVAAEEALKMRVAKKRRQNRSKRR
jgi:hypothetical protein